MNWFSTPKRVEVGDVALSTVVATAALLFCSDRWLASTHVTWPLGLFLLPLFGFGGFVSAWLFYRRQPRSVTDPFYIRAWWSLIGGLVALPVCLLFRPVAAPLAFIAFTFGLGPVIGFHVYRRLLRPKD